MKFLKGFLKLIGILVVLVLINRWYVGGFAKLTVVEKDMWAYTIAYKNFVGEYSKVWPTITKVYEILSGAGVTSETGVGIYYDDPAVVSWADLRSDIGAVIADNDASKLTKNPDIKIMKISAGTKIVVEFPLKNSLSYMVGPMRAYPVIAKYMKEKGYTHEVPMIELYGMTAKKIYFIADISN